MKYVACGLLMTCMLGATLAAEPNEAPVAPRRTSAKLLNHPHLEWPAGETDREAMVFLRVQVSPQGRVSDSVLIEDRGFHNPDFVLAARNAAKALRFTPATLDGKPVEQYFILPVAFSLGKAAGSPSKWVTGITPEFRAEAMKVDDLIKKGDYAGADFHAQWMLKEKVHYGYELAVLNATLAETHASLGDDFKALKYAEEATQRTTADSAKFDLHQPVPVNHDYYYLLPKAVVANLLELRMQVATRDGMLKRALQAYYELAGLVEMKPDDPRARNAALLMTRLEGNAPLTVRGALDEDGWWSHELYRRHFTLEKVQGNVLELSLKCGSKYQALPYAPAEEWTVPTDWEDCVVWVGAEAGIKFLLIELTD